MTSTRKPALAVLLVALTLAACGDAEEASSPPIPDESVALPASGAGNAAGGTRPSGAPALVTREGRIESGTECPVLQTSNGETWALSLGEADFGPGDYVVVTGELADASICMEGEGTILPQSIEAKEPLARDRDPALAGGIALTTEYVSGEWVAKGDDCERPDFEIEPNANGMALLEGRVNSVKQTVPVSLGDDPAIQFSDPMLPAPIEARGPDGLAVVPAEGSGSFVLGSERVAGDGSVFVKCADDISA